MIRMVRMDSGWQSAMAEISVNGRAGRKEGMRQLEPWAMISKTLIRPPHCTLHRPGTTSQGSQVKRLEGGRMGKTARCKRNEQGKKNVQ